MLVPIAQVAPGIFRIGPVDHGRPSNPTSPYLVVGRERAAVLEPGEDGLVPAVVQAIRECDLELDSFTYIMPTHIHLHHIQGVPLLLNHLTKAKVLVHPRGAPHLIEPTRLVRESIEAWGDKCYGPFPPIPREKVMVVEDGQVIDLGGRELEIIYTPGHSAHHLSFFDRQTRALFSGDMVALHTPGNDRGHHDIRPPLFDVEKWLQSLHRLQALKPSLIITHREGGVVFAPQNTLKWAEEDMMAIERICREGMKAKMSFRDMARSVQEYGRRVGALPRRESDDPAFSSGGLSGLIAYIRRKDPSLEFPADFTQMMRGG